MYKQEKTRKQKWGSKAAIWILQVTNWKDYTREDLDMAKERETSREKLNLS